MPRGQYWLYKIHLHLHYCILTFVVVQVQYLRIFSSVIKSSCSAWCCLKYKRNKPEEVLLWPFYVQLVNKTVYFCC